MIYQPNINTHIEIVADHLSRIEKVMQAIFGGRPFSVTMHILNNRTEINNPLEAQLVWDIIEKKYS